MKRTISFVILLSVLLSIGTVLAEDDISYIYEDNGSGSIGWQRADDYDLYHSAVYEFSSDEDVSESEELFDDEFEDGTYTVSFDFKIDGVLEAESSASIDIESETDRDKTSLLMFENGDAKIEVRDAGGRRLRPALVKSEIDWSNWKNYSVIYEKSGDELSITQYLDGEKLHDAVTSYDNFRLKKIIINHPKSETDATLYIDNIACRKINDDEPFAFEKITPVTDASDNSVDYFEVKLNRAAVKSSISQISVLNEDDEECIEEYEAVGQYIYVEVNNIGQDDCFTLTVTGLKDLFENELEKNTYTNDIFSEPSEVLLNDCNAEDLKWAKEADYDEEHGDVYSFETGQEHAGSDRFTSAFEDGIYIVSMDFKVPVYPISGKYIDIYTDSEGGNKNRTQLSLRTEGYESYSVSAAGKDISGGYHTVYSNSYTADAWNNYSVVYEKSGTTVEITQYINGIKLGGPFTGNDDFRLKRITVNTLNSDGAVLYLDNIVVMHVNNFDIFTSKVKPCKENIISVEFNSLPLYSTLKSVKVKDAEGKNAETGNISFCGNVMDIELKNGTDGEKYSVKFNTSFLSVTGKAIKQDTGGNGGNSGGDSGINRSIYGALVYSSGEEQIFTLDAAVSESDVRHGTVLDLVSPTEEYVGLKDELKAELGKEALIISCDFKVGDTAYLNNIGVKGEKDGVRIRRNGHARQDRFRYTGEFLEKIGPTGGALIKDIIWPEDGRWANICFVTTPSGVEFYLDNKYLAKSPYTIGDVTDIFAHFKPTNNSQIDNFMIIDKNDYLLTAVTSDLTAYENDEQTEICVRFTAPISAESVTGLSVTDSEGSPVDIGEPEVAGTNIYIPLLSGEAGEKYSVNIPNVKGLSGLEYQKGPELVETSKGMVVQPSVMKCAFEAFDGTRSAYALKIQPLIKEVMLTLSGMFTKEDLKENISIYCGDIKLPYDINIQEDTGIGITVAKCVFDEVLKPRTDYKVEISGSLTERVANELSLGGTKSYSFRTEDCDDIVLLSGIADGTVSKEIQIYKKGGFSQSFFHTAAKRSTVKMIVDGVEKDVERLDEFHYKVTSMTDGVEGVRTLSLDDFADCEYSLATWPDLSDMSNK